MIKQKEVDARVQGCLAIEDNMKSLGCLKKAVRKFSQAEGVCRPRIVLLTQDLCDSCKEEKSSLRKSIDAGEIVEVSLEMPEGRDIARRNGIDFVPAVLLLDCNNNLIDPAV